MQSKTSRASGLAKKQTLQAHHNNASERPVTG